jgi:hypothetical protein
MEEIESASLAVEGWKVKRGEHVMSARDLKVLQDWAREGSIRADDSIWVPAKGEWLGAAAVPELSEFFSEASVPSNSPQTMDVSDEDPSPSIWRHPVFLFVGVCIIAWTAYVIGHRQSPSSPPAVQKQPVTIPESPRVIYVQSAPQSAPVHASASTTTPPATPAPTVVASEVRRGEVTERNAKAASPPEAEVWAVVTADEKRWRERTAAARARLEKAQATYDKVSEMNTVSVMGTMNRATQNDYAVAMAARNAALTPYQLELDAAREEIERLPEDCRKAGCQPGWIR